ncbi:guided entry of tail-anchored proteins factor 1 [Hyalella azteca]|uniref:Guided entry of tail-anchored proteins factor 1 n=1 Tax=Hyalella azteca TaxID=294128 RepID=A0A8B7NK97_HYAAZ|nr:guided entry of tail-anchored proteins factor 1 [Hyalella azteca]
MAFISTLVVASLVSCASYIASPVKNILGRFVCGGEKAEEKRLLSEISSLKRSLQSISMTDQFPDWAKLQRQINAVTQKYQAIASQRYKQEQMIRRVCSVLVDVVVLLFTLWYVWYSRGSAVAALPAHLLTPLENVLAMPACEPGQISVMVWMACVRSLVSRVAVCFSTKAATAAAT